MRLHSSLVKDHIKTGFSRTSRETGDKWELDKVLSVGNPGIGYREIIIPVIDRPGSSDDSWGVVTSRRGKPKLVQGIDSSSGSIFVLSTRRERGHSTGEVYVHADDKDNIEVMACGIGGRRSTRQRWFEYVIICYRPTRFYMGGVPKFNVLISFDGNDFTEQRELEANVVDLKDYIGLRDSSIQSWWKDATKEEK